MNYKKYFPIALFSLVAILTCSFPTLANASWTDQDFESFNVGNLNEQGDWTVSWGSSSVSTDQALSGQQSIYSKRVNTNYNSSINYTINSDLLIDYDTISFSFYKANITGGNYQRMEFRPRNSTHHDFCMIHTFDDGIFLHFGNSTINIGTFSADTWTTVSINYDLETRKCRAKINDNPYSAYYDFSYSITEEDTNIMYLNLQNYDETYGYFDDVKFLSTRLPLFTIISPEESESVINDSLITVSGICPTDGANRIGFTNECLGFNDIQYNVACSSGNFSGQFYKSGLSDRIIAREIDSVSGDCVDYDELMSFIEVTGIDVIEGYPDDWYFNFNYYDDYDIRILSPIFDTALTLPTGTTSKDFTVGFIYPTAQLPNLNFNIKQYDSSGTLLNANYHNKNLSDMTDTWNYVVNLSASPTEMLHYVVQLTESGEMKRQYPFAIAVSDLDFIYNPDDYTYFFPRLVEELKKKIIFNYYFAFHDNFYDMFNANYAEVSDDALDITFKSVSGDGEYNMDVKIFSASNPIVKSFTSGLRPYIVAILWLIFALYVVFKVTRLFNNDD